MSAPLNIAMRPLPTQEELRRVLAYDPETGAFSWQANINMRGRRPEPGTIRAGYRDICFNKTHYGSHRLAWKLFYGRDPLGEIDHINGDRTDNRISNLRCVTPTENRRNSAVSSANTSGQVGVHFKKERQKWVAFISLDGRYTHLGYSDTKEGAVALRKAAEREHGFHPNHGRKLCLA